MKNSDNTILITGGGSGIGQALAIELHKAGNHVIIAGRRLAALQETAAANPGISIAQLNVDDTADINSFVATVVAQHPNINVLINNAGIMQGEDLTQDTIDLSIAEATITTNLLGPIRLTSAFLPHLKKQKSATIINVTSGLAFVPLAYTPTYSATKAALHSYTQSLRHQLRETSVEVLELAPPAVATDLMPGHKANPHSMPLADYIAESMAILKNDPPHQEILVERVKFLRNAESNGSFEKVFGILNPA